MDKKKKTHVHFKIDPVVWEEAKPVIREMGFSQSGFIEIMLKQFVRAETVPFSEVLGDIFKEAIGAQQRKKKRARD